MRTVARRRAKSSALALASVALLACSGTRSTPGAEHAERPAAGADHRPASSDGRAAFRATSHRRFDDVDYWSKVFDDPRRDAWQRPDRLVKELGIDVGDRVADIGAGTGYLIERLSHAVGPRGSVFAVEVEPSLVAHLRSRAERAGLANVTPILASIDDPRLPASLLDLVVILDTYHHIDHRDAYLRRLRRTLRSGGRIAVIDWRKEPLPVGPPPDHKIERERVVAEMQAQGLRLVREPSVLEYQYYLIFEVP